MPDIHALSSDEIDGWANDRQGPVALHLRQKLLPVEGPGGVIFPPTYAFSQGHKGPPYNIDVLDDGTKVALMDSVGSQANRIEPIFKTQPKRENPLATLVPQIEIEYDRDETGQPKTVSLLEAGHRLGDAVVRASGPSDDGTAGPENEPWDLAKEAKRAFETLLDRGDATPIAKMAPTSLVFGAWDSRDTEAKVPRLVQATIRAWDVSVLSRSAQYNPTLDYKGIGAFDEKEIDKASAEVEKSGGKSKDPLAQRGFVHVPAVDQHGGIVARGDIVRDVTVNLVALRRLAGENSDLLRRYILGLSLVAATEPPEVFLRQGCLLTIDPDAPDCWEMVDRKGRRTAINLDDKKALDYAQAAADAFGVGPNRNAKFDKSRAKKDRDAAKKK